MALPSYSVIIKKLTADGSIEAVVYETSEAAKAAYLLMWGTGEINALDHAFLIEDAVPTAEYKKPTWSGTYVDAYGVTRVIGTNEID